MPQKADAPVQPQEMSTNWYHLLTHWLNSPDESDRIETALTTPFLADAPYDPIAVTMCPNGHGPQEVWEDRTIPGFTGRPIFIYELNCGDQIFDASLDTIEAVR
jgi:hypothetical protein